MNSGYETLDAHAKLEGDIPGIYLTIKTLLNRKVIKAQLNDLSIEDETDIFTLPCDRADLNHPNSLKPRAASFYSKTWRLFRKHDATV